MIADPGRSPFEELGTYFEKNLNGEILEWNVRRPRNIQGRILKVGSLDKKRKKRK
jgi:hypothetical protein